MPLVTYPSKMINVFKEMSWFICMKKEKKHNQERQIILHQRWIYILFFLTLLHWYIFFSPLECIYKPLNYFQKQGRKKRIKIPGIPEGKKTKQNPNQKTNYHLSIAKHLRFLCFPSQNIPFWGLSSSCGAPCKTIPSGFSNQLFYMGKRKKDPVFQAHDGQTIWSQLCHKIHMQTLADNLA